MNNVQKYYLPEPTPWPIFGCSALLMMAVGAAAWVNRAAAGLWLVSVGAVLLLIMLIGWFGTVIRENNAGLLNRQVDASFRWAMAWFVFSEVMVFVAFFGALFYLRVLAVPDLASGESGQLWPGFKATWPTAGPLPEGSFSPMVAWGVPTLNTVILLTSGAIVTWANFAIARGERGRFKLALLMTIILGVLFLCLQASEYHHAFTRQNLSLSSGAYGATFFALTGLHGIHVMIGTTILIFILARALRGQFTPEHHFAFTAASWYWHFVGVLWLVLFVLVYCL
ncbi:MAG: cytochrome c oxidase subunit 3 [Betaproteobacteria bacterium]|nr:MAG: cytochrome c oxidase subunit 3 [Betaproteobacteria bacterium]